MPRYPTSRLAIVSAVVASALILLAAHRSGTSSSDVIEAYHRHVAPQIPWFSDAETCIDIPTHRDSGFAASLCRRRRACDVAHVEIWRTDEEACAAAEARRPTAEEDQVALEETWRGPDLIHVLVDGDQTWAVEDEVEYFGGCRYRYRLEGGRDDQGKPLNGELSLKIVLMFENYDYWRPEPAVVWRSMQPIVPSSADASLPLANWTSYAPPTPLLCSSTARPRAPALYPSSSRAQLPPCSRTRPVRGNYLPPEESDAEWSWQGYQWTPEGCSMTDIMPDPYAPPEEAERWTRRKRMILFWGDSHLRFAFRHFNAVIQQDIEHLHEPITGKTESETSIVRNVTSRYFWNTHATFPGCGATVWDTIVISAGHHNLLHLARVTNPQDAYGHVYVLDEWTRQILDLFESLQKCFDDNNIPKPRLIFMSPPARDPTTAGPVNIDLGDVDGRSNARLARYTYSAFDALSASPALADAGADVRLVDQFALTLPFMWHAPDGLHFHHTDAMSAITHELLWKIGLVEGLGEEWEKRYDESG